MDATTRAKAVRAAFDADNWHRTYSDEEYQRQVEDGYTEYLERIVDAVAGVIAAPVETQERGDQ